VLDDCCCLFVFVDEEGIRQGAAYACVDTRMRQRMSACEEGIRHGAAYACVDTRGREKLC
jgi:hypothetical protein